MAEPYLGEIHMFAGTFAPRGYALCNGQLVPVSQNAALFSLLGTQFGGDGRSTFALPNLQGNVPLSQGQPPGGNSYAVGQVGGEASHTLSIQELPYHTHNFNADTVNATVTDASGNLLGKLSGRQSTYYAPANPANLAPMASNAVGAGGGSQPHPNQQPFLVVNFCIAMQGAFPLRP